MNRRLWWVLLVVLAVSMTLFTACEDLLNPDEDNPDEATIDAALVGTWVTYTSDAEVPENVDMYSGVRLNSDGTGTAVSIFDNGVSTPEVEVTGFTWSAESGDLQINVITPSVDTMHIAYTLSEGNNVVSLVGTNGDNTGQETLVKYQPNRDASLSGKWLIETPAEEAGAIIQLNTDGSGTYTDPSSNVPDAFTWGTNSGYIGILVYQDLAGYVARYTVTAEAATLTFPDRTMTLAKLDEGGSGGTIDDRLVDTWLWYTSNAEETSEDDGEHYATLTLRDDGTGSHVSVYEDWENDDIVTEAIAFTYSVETDSVAITFINPPQDMPASFKIGFELLDSDNVLVLSGADGAGSVDTYIRHINEHDTAVQGTWYVVTPYEDLDSEIVLNSDGSGSYTGVNDTESDLFTWGTGAGYVAILMYDNVGMVASYEVDGDAMTLGTPFGTMLLSRTSSGTGGGGSVVPGLVGEYVFYTMEYQYTEGNKTTPVNKTMKSMVTNETEIDYVEGASMVLNDDGTGSYYYAWYDNEGPMTQEVPFTWGEVMDGILLIQYSGDSEYSGESMIVEYYFDGDMLTFSYGDDYWGGVETYYRLTSNRPSAYYGTYFYYKETLDPPVYEDYYMPDDFKMTMILEADGGVVYQQQYMWDDVNQQDVRVDFTQSFLWSISADNYHYVQYDPESHQGRVVTFAYTEVHNSARLEAYSHRWEWDSNIEESVLVEVTTIFYLESGLNGDELGGDWIAAEMLNDVYEKQGVPQLNLHIDPSSGRGYSTEMQWNDDTQMQELYQSEFTWYNADGKFIVVDDHDVGPYYGQVMAYNLEGNGLYIDVGYMGDQMGPMIMFFVRDTGTIDSAIEGDWELVEIYEDDTSMTPDPNGALYFGNDGRGSYTHTDEWDGETIITDNFSFSTQGAGESSYVIVNPDEPAGEPVLDLRDAYEYIVATEDGRLHIYTKTYTDWGTPVVYHEIYVHPAP